MVNKRFGLGKKMKQRYPAALLALIPLLAFLAACEVNVNTDPDEEPGSMEVPEKYKEFHNYPAGRQSASGTLEIRNSAASPVLLFTDSVAGANYIGTADSLNSIKVKLPEEKFYTIVAVDKAVWEERGDQASQYSNLTYFSNTQPYSLSVNADSTYGGGTWIINNYTNYWVSFRKADQSGTIFAVAPPNARRVSVPIKLNENYDYIPHFHKELKYQGKIVALIESDVLSAADTAVATDTYPIFNSNIGQGSFQPPSANIAPAIFLDNDSGNSVRVYSGLQNQLTDGSVGVDFPAVGDGREQMLSGVGKGTNTNSINFQSIGWDEPVYVTQSMSMQMNKVYRIVLNSDHSTTVTEEDAAEYYE